MPNPSKPTRPRPPSRSGKSGPSAPRRPGKPSAGRSGGSSRGGRAPQPAFPWQWLAAGIGGLLLVVALFFGARALFAPPAMPTPLLPTATPPGIALTETPTPEADETPPAPPDTAIISPDIPALQTLMHQRINENRRANGLREVAWDETAALAGTQHAREMAQYGYLSHRNLDGYGPDYRYSAAGGMHHVMENVHATQHTAGGAPTSAAEWEQWVRKAQEDLMASDGHRANILAPEHTHVGIGMAYDPATGYFAIAQEFVNQYTTVQPLLRTASLGQEINLTGWLNVGASDPLLNIAYEPQPTPLSVAALQPETYSSPAENYDIPAVRVGADRQFTANFTLDNADQPGLYHIRLWVDTDFGQVQALNLVIQVH